MRRPTADWCGNSARAVMRFLFLERDLEWYAANRDLPKPPYGRTVLYRSLAELKRRFAAAVRQADCVIVGSYVQEGAAIGAWVTQIAEGVTAFLRHRHAGHPGATWNDGDIDYLSRALIPRYQLYLSFTGGPILDRLEKQLWLTDGPPAVLFGGPRAVPSGNHAN